MSTPDKDIRYAITAEDRFSRTFGQLKRDISGSKAEFGGLIDKASAVNLALGSITLGAIGGAGLALGIKRLVDDLDALNDAAYATGSSIENLSALEDVARRNGQSLETVVSAALNFNKVLNEATAGSEMEKTLARIGLSAKELRDVDPSIGLQQLAQALSRFADDGDKARLVLELTGKSVKDLAALLKDLGEAGKLNAKVTTDQAQQAEKFNKELFALQTNASNAARAIVADLVPALNKLFDDKRSGGLSKMLGLEAFGAQADQAVAAYRLIGLARERITPLQILDKDPTNAKALAELDRIDAKAKELAKTFKKANDERLKITDGSAGAGRGFINPEPYRSSVGAAPGKADKAAKLPGLSEAQRYLETLTKQGEKLEDLTVYQQLLRDIEAKRLDGITPKLERELKIAAQRVDLQKKLNDEKEREVGFQKLLSDKSQRDIDDAQRLLDQTPKGRQQGLENQADKLLAFSGKIGPDDPRQAQVLQAMEALNKQAKELAAPVDTAKTAFDSLADSIEKTMDRSTDAILDFVLGADTSFNTLWKSFGRDILRELIGDPVRDTMKGLVKDIRATFISAGQEGNPVANLFKGMFGGSSGGGGFGDILGIFGQALGFTSRANGGGVNKGDLVRWQENGREWFVPNTDGTVINQQQMRGIAGGGAVNQVNHFTINGGDPADVQRQITAALARNNAMLLRSSRTGGAFAAA